MTASDLTSQPDVAAVRRAVVDRYAARARAVLESAGVAPSTAACCPPATPTESQPIEFVEALDRAVLAKSGGELHYGSANYDAANDLAGLPESVVGASAGCGNPLAIAELTAGERVLDLGSGGGIDCFLAAQQVGETGAVWGLDMTPEMIDLARHNAAKVGAFNVRFRLGEIEDLPFSDASFDLVMSNCVINLSTDKPRVFAEAYRVLAPGGRLRVSDMVWTAEPSEATRASLEQWAGCVAGAMLVDDYVAAIRAAGFENVAAEYAPSDSGLVSASVFARRPV